MQVEVYLSNPTLPPTCHQSHTTEHPDISMSLSNRGMATMIGGSSTIVGKSQTKEGILMPLMFPSNTNNDSTSIMLNALENFTAKISMQQLAQAALGSIQELDGKDKATTIPWLDQVELVVERKVMIW